MPGFADGPMGIHPAVAAWLPRVVTVSITPASVAQATVAEQNFNVTGATVGDAVNVTPPALTAGVVPAACRVVSAGVIGVQFANSTAGSLTPPAGNYIFSLIKST